MFNRAESRSHSLPCLGTKKGRWLDGRYIMAILNATPDSFSHDGLYDHSVSHEPENFVRAIQNVMASGADILDIGAESSRPDSSFVPADQQIQRLEPVFDALKFLEKQPITSLDTSDSKVAAWGLEHGVQIINDIHAGDDPDILRCVAEHDAEIVLMHNSSKANRWHNLGKIGNSYAADTDANIVMTLKNNFEFLIDRALTAGIESDKIILDPGIGFGKNVSDNIRLVLASNEFARLGFAVLVGASRKSFIGKIQQSHPTERLEGSLITHIEAWRKGAHIVRVHDVGAHFRGRAMLSALQNPADYEGL